MIPCVAATDIPIIVAYNKLTSDEKRTLQNIADHIAKAVADSHTQIDVLMHEELITFVYDESVGDPCLQGNPSLQKSFEAIIKEVEQDSLGGLHYATYHTQGSPPTATLLSFLELCNYEVDRNHFTSAKTTQCPDYYYLWPTVRKMFHPRIKKLARTELITIKWPIE